LRQAGLRSLLGVPMIAEGDAVGVLVSARATVFPTFPNRQIAGWTTDLIRLEDRIPEPKALQIRHS
jgi:hypothetical protein